MDSAAEQHHQLSDYAPGLLVKYILDGIVEGSVAGRGARGVGCGHMYEEIVWEKPTTL